MAGNETHYNAIVGIIGGELAVLDYVFKDSESFKGATGYRMGTITQDYIDYRKESTDEDNYRWREAVANGSTILGFYEWWEVVCNEAERHDEYFPLDDKSFRHETNELYENLSDDDRKKIEEIMGVKGTDYVDFNCASCGRCFNADEEWDLILRPDLVELINKMEA